MEKEIKRTHVTMFKDLLFIQRRLRVSKNRIYELFNIHCFLIIVFIFKIFFLIIAESGKK
ncbi:hypothetical protein BpHYR1_012494 [Brachionus plicatilis]|uniref:Uncharacterized protein n=1 Tax=Brachionus plicatilis TaxID=10195 RepID=A0A3M7SWB8_BRAPC|nr:hypothetical protein BpHYR1_012494 [Brachionus plicatilis]